VSIVFLFWQKYLPSSAHDLYLKVEPFLPA
jgi:hypothetical protein